MGGRYLGDATIAAAVFDRLAKQAIGIDIDSRTYRQDVAAERAARPGCPGDDTARPATAICPPAADRRQDRPGVSRAGEPYRAVYLAAPIAEPWKHHDDEGEREAPQPGQSQDASSITMTPTGATGMWVTG